MAVCLNVAPARSGIQLQRKPNIEKDADPKPVPPPAPRSRRARASSPKARENATARKLPSEYTLTFVTNVPDADVAVDGEPLGKAGKNGRLTVKVPSGRHNVTVAHPRYQSKSKPVDIGPGLTEIGFQLEEIPPPPAVAEAAPPPATPPEASKPAVDIDAVFKRFLGGSEPNTVSADEWKEVAEFAEKSLATDRSGKLRPRMLFAHGQAQFQRAQYTLALVAFTESTQAAPDFAPAYYGAGNTYMATNLVTEAIKLYEHAVELSPDFALAHKALGDALARQGNRPDSTQSYRRALEAGYTGSDLPLRIARNLMADKRWSQALTELRDLVQKQPAAEALIAMGECHEGLKNNFSAAMAFYKATDLDDKSAVAHFKLGLILLENREFEPAKEALSRALALDPKGEKIRLAEAHKALNEASSKVRK
jgi:tetratricopeptide (TPR) repeat protein